MKTRLTRLSTASFVALPLLIGCSTSPPPKEPTVAEKLREDSKLVGGLSEHFESQLSIRRDMDVSVYLRRVAQNLADGTEPLKHQPVGVQVIKDRTSRWRSYSLAGNRVYLSAGLLRKLEFENQVAALIAFEFGNIIGRHAATRVKAKPELAHSRGNKSEAADMFPGDLSQPARSIDYFGPSGIFAFTEEEYVASAHSALEILYAAGYDTRGLISIWQLYQANPESSPFEPSALAKLIDKTRSFYAENPPLRNPIVRTEEFLKIRKRIERL